MTHCAGGPMPEKTVGWCWGFLFGFVSGVVCGFIAYLKMGA